MNISHLALPKITETFKGTDKDIVHLLQMKTPKNFFKTQAWKDGVENWEFEHAHLKPYYEINNKIRGWVFASHDLVGIYVHPDLVYLVIAWYVLEDCAKEHCYLIHLMNEVNQNIPVYKIGKSCNINQRMLANEYKNCKQISIVQVSDCSKCEREIIRTFTKKFKLVLKSDKSNFGTEFFEGDIGLMKQEFERICEQYSDSRDGDNGDSDNRYDVNKNSPMMNDE
jgi:hypothetical protein